MTTNALQTVNQVMPYVDNSNMTSIKSYSEFMLNKMMFDKILNTKTAMEFTPANIGKLMLIMCAPDIKTLVVEAGKYLAGLVKDSPQYLFTALKYIFGFIQSIKRTVSYGLGGRWLPSRHRKQIDYQPENLEKYGREIDMWQSAEKYSLTVDSIFTAELIKFIETHKHKHTKSCVSMNIDGVNITRKYMLRDIVINWMDDNRPVEIEINNPVVYTTTAKLTNSANETLVNIYEFSVVTPGAKPGEYVFPPELGITEYWDLLSNPIFKKTYPFLDVNNIIARKEVTSLLNKTLLYAFLAIDINMRPSIIDIYITINRYITKQQFKVYGIPNATPDITNHCLTLLMIYFHLGCNNDKCLYKNYMFECYTINPLLININLYKFIADIRQLLNAKGFIGLFYVSCDAITIYSSRLKKDVDIFWSAYLNKGLAKIVYNSYDDNNINFSSTLHLFHIPNILNKKLTRDHVTQERFDKFMSDNSLEQQITTAKETKLVFLNIHLKTQIPAANSSGVLAKFLETIRANSTSLNTKTSNPVPVKYIKLKQIETITETDNPAYKEWVKKKDLLLSNIAISPTTAPIPINTAESGQGQVNMQMQSCNTNSGATYQSAAINSFLPSLVDSMPPEKLVNTTTKLVIDEQTINQTCRQMQSLSLKSRDKKKLMCALDDYLEDGPTLKAWGIKNKLNILLYGEPGTGKSSTIEAIATYLNKPIYYVDMKEARTNNDLKLIFDHVNSVAVGGGIIVMEDIDAMTDCVHIRTHGNEANLKAVDPTVSAIMADRETNTLTLEFFLNILDGVLTADKSIFITTTNHIEKLDPAFYRAGRFNLKIELGPCNHDQMNYIYRNMRGSEIPSEILSRIPENVYKPAEFIFHIKDFVRDFTFSDDEILEPFMLDT